MDAKEIIITILAIFILSLVTLIVLIERENSNIREENISMMERLLESKNETEKCLLDKKQILIQRLDDSKKIHEAIEYHFTICPLNK